MKKTIAIILVLVLSVFAPFCCAFADGEGYDFSDWDDWQLSYLYSQTQEEMIRRGLLDSNSSEQSSEKAETENETEAAPTSAQTEKKSRLNIPDVIPSSYEYDGYGDSVFSIDHPSGIFVFYIRGNSESRHFSVKGYDSNDKVTDLFVNTTDPYEGITIDPSQETVLLEVNSKGSWHIEIRSIWTCDIIDNYSTYYGTGDNILLLDIDSKIAQIEGNKDARHFAVKTFGDKTNLLVNTTDVYSGTVRMKDNPYLIEVNSKSNWSITLGD